MVDHVCKYSCALLQQFFRYILMTQEFNESDTSKCRHFEPTCLKYNIFFTTLRKNVFSQILADFELLKTYS